jgi:hypothetical protein
VPGLTCEGPTPSAALCEATTLSARSAASLGVITADRRRFFAEVGATFCGRYGRMRSPQEACQRIWLV